MWTLYSHSEVCVSQVYQPKLRLLLSTCSQAYDSFLTHTHCSVLRRTAGDLGISIQPLDKLTRTQLYYA